MSCARTSSPAPSLLPHAFGDLLGVTLTDRRSRRVERWQ
jgi:hypothetical protein